MTSLRKTQPVTIAALAVAALLVAQNATADDTTPLPASDAASGDNDEDDDVVNETSSDRPEWTVAAGIGLLGGGLAGLGSGVGAAPLASALLEHRLGTHVWLLARVHGSYGTSSEGNHEARQGGLGGALGTRLMLNPDQPFQFSAFATLGAESWFVENQLTHPEGYVESATEGADVFSARVGGAIDRELIEGLGLRLAIDVGRVSYSRAGSERIVAGVSYGGYGRDSWDAALTFNPSLEVRMSF